MKNALILVCLTMLSSIANGQTTWYEIPTGTDSKLNSIDFPSDNVGYIVGENMTILKTTNGGQTWDSLGPNGISVISGNDNFTSIDFINENIGFLVSGYSGVWRTSDGGQSWVQASTAMCFPHTTHTFSGTDYLIGGGDCFQGARIDKVVNGSLNPANIATNFWNDQQKVAEMSFSSPLNGLAAVRNEYILKTIDGGNNWDTISTGILGAHTSIVMVNDTLCYAGYQYVTTSGFGILKSTDGGLTWSQDVNSATFFYPDYLSVHAAANGDIYSGAVSSNSPGGLIFESEDGVNWAYYDVDQPINDLTSVGSDITFGIGDSGYLVVNTPIADLGLTEDISLEFTISPNPVKDILTIDYPTNEKMVIRIFDNAGRLVLSENMKNTFHQIDISHLNNGSYLLELEVGQQTGVQRIMKI